MFTQLLNVFFRTALFRWLTVCLSGCSQGFALEERIETKNPFSRRFRRSEDFAMDVFPFLFLVFVLIEAILI